MVIGQHGVTGVTVLSHVVGDREGGSGLVQILLLDRMAVHVLEAVKTQSLATLIDAQLMVSGQVGHPGLNAHRHVAEDLNRDIELVIVLVLVEKHVLETLSRFDDVAYIHV